MNIPVNKVVAFSPADSAAPLSRLERSNKATLTTLAEITAFFDQHHIPYELRADFIDKVLTSAAMKEVFCRSFGMQPLRPSTAPHKGASTVLAFELQSNRATANYHGEVVSTIADFVGSHLQPGVDVIFIKDDPNPGLRGTNKKKSDALVELFERLGAPVIISSFRWDDVNLTYDHGTHWQFGHFFKVNSFVVDAVGNEGIYGTEGEVKYPVQKHRASCHAPPLAVTVGAVERTEDGKLEIAGYSSVAGPTFLTVVPKQATMKWDSRKDPAAVTGTSAASPIGGSVLGALNEHHGPYLTREQILFATIATCTPVTQVAAFAPQTPHAYSIEYQKNAAGFAFNAGPGGFGLINEQKADHILTHMVALTQRNPDLITVPTEDRVEVIVQNPTQQKSVGGRYNYVYEVEVPPGHALKTTLEVEFVGMHGKITATSPSGSKFPIVTSMLPIQDINALTPERAYFGLGTTHAWAGEETGGKWIITSTTPIRRMRFNNHHFLDGDLVHNLDIATLLKTPVPDLSNAVRLIDLKPQLTTRQCRIYQRAMAM